jgi:hypothetical protein
LLKFFLSANSAVKWEEVKYLIPGLLYGEPHTRPNALGGIMYYNAKHFSIGEPVLYKQLSKGN